MPTRSVGPSSERGFMLLEIVIAVGIFAFAVVGLATAMNRLIDVELVSREDVRIRMEIDSRLAEARLAELTEGATDLGVDTTGIRYRLVISPLDWRNINDEPLNGLFLLKVSALSGDEEIQSAEVIAYGHL